MRLSQPVERLGIGFENLLCLRRTDHAEVGPSPNFVEGAQVRGDIGVAVVGANHEVIFSAELQQRFDFAAELLVSLRPFAEIRGAFVDRAFERAVEAGLGERDFAAVIEPMREGR